MGKHNKGRFKTVVVNPFHVKPSTTEAPSTPTSSSSATFSIAPRTPMDNNVIDASMSDESVPPTTPSRLILSQPALRSTPQSQPAPVITPKSGRTWKSSESSSAHQTLRTFHSVSSKWAAKQRARAAASRNRALASDMLEASKQRRIQLRENAEHRKAVREENEKKSRIVQVIGAAKVRRMNRQQLKSIEKA